jgi:ribosome biogenesis GTPase
VGKSTLIAGLTGMALATAPIREDDAKGRHTTTGRALLPVNGGGWVIDTPGMRELALQGAADGIDDLFDDILALAEECRFRDCAHGGEPGCAVQAAVAKGALDPQRLARWEKLRREDARNSEALHERRDRDRAFGRMVRDVKARKRRERGD